MVIKNERKWGLVMILFFVSLFIVGGAGGYYYYIRHKEPTQGIFVYDQGIRGEEFIRGYLYQPS